jgi:UDP-glucose 4-epimerase
MKVLITGGLGFIGSNLVEYLLAKKNIQKIIIIDNFSKSSTRYLDTLTKYKLFTSPKNYKNSHNRVQVINCNINNKDFAFKVTKNIDYIVHLAAESGVDVSISKPYESFQTNVLGAYNYIEASRRNNVKRFIFASSGAVFGDTQPPLKESNVRAPISPYGSSKLTIETFCETYSNVFDLNTTILRFSNAYGPYSLHKQSIISKFINNILSKKSIIVNGNGNITRDYVHVSDICSAIYKSIKDKNGANIYHVGTGKETSIKQLIKIFKNECVNYDISVIYGSDRVGDMKKNYTSITKIKKYLKWSPKISLKKGFSQTFKWFLKQK